uniref:Uncharacterized protein n=1 Tax=Globisporangium ultimum (strain ATCC 200006 / CBS 805.95 / DAOM BR144) TaxID=431595 RepID=K3X0J8_GLOUD
MGLLEQPGVAQKGCASVGQLQVACSNRSLVELLGLSDVAQEHCDSRRRSARLNRSLEELMESLLYGRMEKSLEKPHS